MARAYFRTVIPDYILDTLDLSTLRPMSESYVSADLKKILSDVVYSCKRKDHKGDAGISLLLEHKSAPDKYTPLQIGSYLFSGYRQQVRQGATPLSPILPILFYHGKDQWEYRTMSTLFGETGQKVGDEKNLDLYPFIPNYQYIYHNLREIPDGKIGSSENKFLSASLLVLKHAFDRSWLSDNFMSFLIDGLPYGDKELQQAFITYYFNRVDFSEKQAEEKINKLPLNIKETVMSTYDRLIEKGRLEEREKVYTEKLRAASKMLESGFDFQLISDILDLPMADIEDLGKK